MGREMILKKIEDGRTVSLEELKSAGFVLAADKSFGRVINKTHLKELKGSLKKDGCIEPVSIFLGTEYLEAYPERELSDTDDCDKNTPRTHRNFQRLSLLQTDFTGWRHTQNCFQRMRTTETP